MLIGYAICGSFCTHAHALNAVLRLVSAGHTVLPILSERAATTDTRFGTAKALREALVSLTGTPPIESVVDAEPLGPALPLDLLVIAPCTGNTLSKIANGASDGTVTLAAKAHLRANRPLLIGLASNDAMSANLASIATLLARKSVYFLPMRQDDPERKPHSLVCDFTTLEECATLAVEGKQKRPLFL